MASKRKGKSGDLKYTKLKDLSAGKQVSRALVTCIGQQDLKSNNSCVVQLDC